MNIQDMYGTIGLDGIINELEAALQIDGKDYEEGRFDIIMKNVLTRINRMYQIDLTLDKVNAVSFESGIYKAAAALFIDNVASIHSRLSAFCQIERYKTQSYVSLSSINYMSYTKDSMRKVLKMLQREKTQMGTSAQESIELIKDRLATVRTCREKRLFMLLVVSYELGFPEVVASIAEILYLGGVL